MPPVFAYALAYEGVHIQVSFNSCRDRHGPKCQSTAREDWIEAQLYGTNELLLHILGDALAAVERVTKDLLGFGVTLFSGFAKALHSFGVIL